MSKEKSPAFQFYPRDWLSDPNVASMSYEQEGWYIHLICHCWLEGRIPAEPAAALRLVGIRHKDICDHDQSELLDVLNKRHEDMAELLAMCFVPDRQAQLKNGEAQLQYLVHPRVEIERKAQEDRRKERSESGKKGGKKSAVKRLQNPSSAWKQLQANSSSSSSSSSKELTPNGVAASQAQPPGDGSPAGASGDGSRKAKGERPKDEAYEIFCSEFSEHRGIPYRSTKGDFVQLASLRKAMNCNGKGLPGEWSRAIGNYLKTPQGKYTLADLCSRYDVFVAGKLDRFGKPEETGKSPPKLWDDALKARNRAVIDQVWAEIEQEDKKP